MLGPSVKVTWLVCAIHGDGTFKPDIALLSSAVKKMFLPAIDNMAVIELETRCRFEVLELEESTFFSNPSARALARTAIADLLAQAQGLRPDKKRKNTRGAAAVATDFEARRQGLVVSITELKRRAAVDTFKKVRPPFERSAALRGDEPSDIHYGKVCGGGCGAMSYINGARYECEQCEEDFCVACHHTHDPAHPLLLHRVAPPYTSDDTWTVTDHGIKSHRDSDGERRFLIEFVECKGNYWCTRAELQNESLINDYESECADYDAKMASQ
jgi:hypothetical protein